jgi:hypothetical protein
LVTGYPIRPEVIPGHLKVGWSIVAKLPVYVKVVRTDALLIQAGSTGAPGESGGVSLFTHRGARRCFGLHSQGDFD